MRACSYINGVDAISVVYRGFNARIAFGADTVMQESPCEFCGTCVTVCPTAALYPKMSLGKGRALAGAAGADDVHLLRRGLPARAGSQGQQDRQGRIRPGTAQPTTAGPASRAASATTTSQHPDRLTKPRVRKYLLDGTPRPADRGEWVEVDWDTALDITARKLREARDQHGANSVGVLTSAKCTNEENYLMNKFARQVIGTNNIDHCARL